MSDDFPSMCCRYIFTTLRFACESNHLSFACVSVFSSLLLVTWAMCAHVQRTIVHVILSNDVSVGFDTLYLLSNHLVIFNNLSLNTQYSLAPLSRRTVSVRFLNRHHYFSYAFGFCTSLPSFVMPFKMYKKFIICFETHLADNFCYIIALRVLPQVIRISSRIILRTLFNLFEFFCGSFTSLALPTEQIFNRLAQNICFLLCVCLQLVQLWHVTFVQQQQQWSWLITVFGKISASKVSYGTNESRAKK